MKQFILQNKRTKLYYAGYIGNSPCWTDRIRLARVFLEEDVAFAKAEKRLLCQSQETARLPALK